MAIRQVPPGIKDTNLANFLRELRAAVGGVSEQVTRLAQTRSSSGGGGGGGGDGGGGTDPGGGGGGGDPGTPPAQTTVVLTIEPLRPTIGNPFTLTATVTGNQPTGRVQFRQNDSLMTLDPVELASGKASVTETIEEKDTYTFIAEYSGDPRNLSAVSNAVTVQFVSNWDGKPAAPSALTASADDPFQIFLKWYNPYIGDYAATEIWGVKQNPPTPSVAVDEGDISGIAVKLGEVASTDYVLSQVDGVALDSGENWYFWVRNRDTEGLYSDWNAAAGTNGKTGIQPGKYLDILTGQITETQLYQDLGDKIDLIVPLGTRVDTVETDIVNLQNEDINLYAQLSLVSAGGSGFDTRFVWHFGQNAESWTGSNATVTAAGGLLTVTSTGTNGYAVSPVFAAVSGADYRIVKIRYRRLTGTSFSPSLKYTTAGNTEYTFVPSGSMNQIIDYTSFFDYEFDLSGEANWTTNSIKQIKIFVAGTSGQGLVFDWIAVGRNAPAASVAQVVDLAQAQIGYCLINGSASNHESKAACEAAGGTWLGNYPLAQSVKQVSVTDGVSTGTIEQKFTAQKVTTDGLRLQYTVKIDNQGFVSGFGLASDPVNGKPYSDFMVRADRFSISNPTIPTWQKSVSSLTHTGTVATVTTSSAHGYSTGQYVMLANIADGYWNRTFKITAVPTTTTFQVACSASEPLSLNPAAVSPGVAAAGLSIYCSRVIIPFIVTTTPTVENGITIPPGVYIDSAHIKDATITEAKIRDAAITNAKIGGFIETAGWTGQAGPAGWKLDKNNSTVEIKGGFALYDTDGSPIITAGRINVQQFRRLILTAQPAEVFTLAKNTGAVSPSAISLVATLQNIVTTGSTASVIWTVTQGTYDGKTVGQTVKTDTGITANTSLTVDPTKFGAGVTVVGFKVACTFGGTTYEDTFTIPKLAEGTDALYLHLTNETDSLNTNADGTFAAGANKISTSGVVVYRGSTNATAETSPTWTITATSNDANTTASYASGTVTVTMQNSSADRVLVTVTATRGSETATKVMTVVKAKQGQSGSGLSLYATSLVRKKFKDGTYEGSYIDVTLVKSGMTATHTWKYAQGTGSLTPTAVGPWNTPQNTTIRIFINQNSGTASSGVGYWYTSNPTAVISVECDGVTDTLTLVELAEGSDAITAVLSNESHSVPTDQDGNNGVYAGASSTLTIYRGITDESASWSVNQTRSNVTVSEGTTSRTATVTAMSQDVGYVDFVATRTGFSSLTKRFSLSKNKKGAPGSAYTVVLTNEASIVPFTGGVGSYTDTPTTALVYSGSTQLGTSSATEWFQITSAIGSGITAGGISGANIGAASNITAPSATITITIAIKDSSGATKATITKVQSITKTENGAFVRLTTTSQVLKPKADNSDYDPRPALNLVTANVTGTPTWEFRRTTAAGVGNWTAAVAPPLPWVLNFTGGGTSWFAATTAMEYRVTVGGITDQITMPVVRDGSSGIDGRRGGVSAYIATFSAAAAWNAIVAAAGSNPVPGDFVETESGSRYGYVSGGYPGSWTSGQSVAFSGNVIVQGTLAANKLAAGEIGSHLIKLGAYANDPNAIIQSNGFQANNSGWRIDGAGNAEFNNVKVRGDVLLGGGNLVQNSEGAHGYTDVVTWSDSWTGSAPQFLTGEEASGWYFNFYQPSGGYSTTSGYMYGVAKRPGTASASRIAVTAGRKYQFSVDALVNATSTRGEIYIDWYNGNTGNTWIGNSGAPVSTTSSALTKLTVFAVAPAGATHCELVFRKFCPFTARNTSFFFTKILFAEVPTGQVSPIPWSPGGISLLDTLALRANAATVVETSTVSSYSCGSVNTADNAITSFSSIVSLPVAAQPVAVQRLLHFSFGMRHADSTPGYLNLVLRRDGTQIKLWIQDVPARIVAGFSDTSYSYTYQDSLASAATATYTMDIYFVNGIGNKWNTVVSGSTMAVLDGLQLTSFTSKR